jgi:Secretion system C-terminal sorting domain
MPILSRFFISLIDSRFITISQIPGETEMKKYLPFLMLLFLSTSFYSQNSWDLVWTLDKKPFLSEQITSEMAIVKAGYDTDQDGWGEFLCAWTDLEANYILMYEASADNTYDLVWYWEYPVSANSFAGIEVGDFDQNGKVEIITTLPTVVADDSPDRIWFFEWSGVQGENMYGRGELGSIAPTKGWNFNLEDGIDFRPYSLVMEDIDKDGDNELIVGVRLGDRGREVLIFSITGGDIFGFGAFKIEFNHQENFGGSLYSVTTGDLDSDGNQDIYALVWAEMTVRFFECTGVDQYELVTSLDSVTAGMDYGAVEGLRIADANGDGINELYIAGSEPDNQLFIVTDISDISQITPEDFKPLLKIPVNRFGKLRTLSIADPDDDGKIDLMIAGETNGQIYDLEYDGIGDPADSTSWELNVIFDAYEYSGFSPDSAANNIDPRFFYGSVAKDMDQDGKNEYLFVNYRTMFSIWPNDKYLYILENDQVTSVENPKDIIPNKFDLEQNYPNPFNPSTTIKYSIPDADSKHALSVQLSIYDLLGREIKTLVNEIQSAGNYEVAFEATDLTSGVYYYKLKVGEFLETKKMILLK